MNDSINKELTKLRLQLQCGKVLFTIISVLLSIVLAPILLIVLLITFALAILIVICYCVALPFIVGYSCITYKYEGEELLWQEID